MTSPAPSAQKTYPILPSSRRKYPAAALRSLGWVPIIFNFEKPGSRTTQETVEMLASLVRYVLADVTDCKSVLQELRGIVPDSPSITVQPVLLAGQEEPGMWDFFKHFPWFRETFTYHNADELIQRLTEGLLGPPGSEKLPRTP